MKKGEEKGYVIEEDTEYVLFGLQERNHYLCYGGKRLERVKDENVKTCGSFAFFDSKLRYFKSDWVGDFEKGWSFEKDWSFDFEDKRDRFKLAQMLYDRKKYAVLVEYSKCVANISEGRVLSYDPLSEKENDLGLFSEPYQNLVVLLTLINSDSNSVFEKVPKEVLHYKIIPFIPSIEVFLCEEMRTMIESEKLQNMDVPFQKKTENPSFDYSYLHDIRKPVKLFQSLVNARKLTHLGNLNMTEIGTMKTVSLDTSGFGGSRFEWALKKEVLTVFKNLFTMEPECETYILRKIHEEIIRFCVHLNSGCIHVDFAPLLGTLNTMFTKYEKRKSYPETLGGLVIRLILQERLHMESKQQQSGLNLIFRICNKIGTNCMDDISFDVCFDILSKLIQECEFDPTMENTKMTDYEFLDSLPKLFQLLERFFVTGVKRSSFRNISSAIDLLYQILSKKNPEVFACFTNHIDVFLGFANFESLNVNSFYKYVNIVMESCLHFEGEKKKRYVTKSKISKTKQLVSMIFVHFINICILEDQEIRINDYNFILCINHILRLFPNEKGFVTFLEQCGVLEAVIRFSRNGNMRRSKEENEMKDWKIVFDMFENVLESLFWHVDEKEMTRTPQVVGYWRRRLDFLCLMSQSVRSFMSCFCVFVEGKMRIASDVVDAWSSCVLLYDTLWSKFKATRLSFLDPMKEIVEETLKQTESSLIFVKSLLDVSRTNWSVNTNEVKVRRYCEIYESLLKKKMEKNESAENVKFECRVTTFFLAHDFRQMKVICGGDTNLKDVTRRLTTLLLHVYSEISPLSNIRSFLENNVECLCFDEKSIMLALKNNLLTLLLALTNEIPSSQCPSLLSSLFAWKKRKKKKRKKKKVKKTASGILKNRSIYNECLDEIIGTGLRKRVRVRRNRHVFFSESNPWNLLLGHKVVTELLKKVTDEHDCERLVKKFLCLKFDSVSELLRPSMKDNIISEIIRLDNMSKKKSIRLWKRFLDTHFFSTTTIQEVSTTTLSLLTIICEQTNFDLLTIYVSSKTEFLARLIFNENGIEPNQILTLLKVLANDEKREEENLGLGYFLDELVSDTSKNRKRLRPLMISDSEITYRFHDVIIFLVEACFRRRNGTEIFGEDEDCVFWPMMKILKEVYGRIDDNNEYYLELKKRIEELCGSQEDARRIMEEISEKKEEEVKGTFFRVEKKSQKFLFNFDEISDTSPMRVRRRRRRTRSRRTNIEMKKKEDDECYARVFGKTHDEYCFGDCVGLKDWTF